MSVQFVKAKRAALKTFILTVVLALFVASAACKRTGTESNANTGANGNSTAASDNTSKTPPFSTKEPERYQATMVVTGSLGGDSPAIPGVSNLLSREMQIARDGDKRRVDYELIPGSRMSDLQTPAGHFMLLHSKKLYAEVKPGAAGDLTAAARNLPSDFSPEKLINETNPGANYEKLGTETLNGRTVTKYRVTTTGKGEGRGLTTETLVWIDESLGMPVKSETVSTGEQARGSKVTMELRDIKQEVDQSLFELPKDYKKVSSEEITAQLIPSLGGLLGGDGEENRRSKGK
ncbi:MAG TPA: hypothetical protein VM911_15390 [Pyrinomonadaceae bacterium]|nr:hypothetical protein [Pyrinomonadaceae bacterium]